ncbi:MAG: glycosyltransferase [Bacteroidales bacterium]|nr:glycosyltransferase [Bacteroidales bacterium]
MRKLLQINPVVRENTSTGKIMRGIGDLAISSGWESYIAYSRARDGMVPHTSKLIPIGNKADLAVHAVATRLLDAHGLASRRGTNELIRQIEAIKPDIIHIHNVHGYFLNYPMLCDFLGGSGIPVVWTAHDCWLYTGHCYYYSAANCDRWKTRCHSCPQKTSFPASWLLDHSASNYARKRQVLTKMKNLHLVAVSEWIKGEIQQSFLSEVPCQVIHNGIDLDVFKPSNNKQTKEKYGIRTPHYVIAVASIWLKEKGFDDLMRLAGLLDINISLVMVGRMTQKQEKALPENVIHIPRTSDAAALAELYSGAVAFLNPTWQDNYPTVNLESIACGTPVITYRTGGSPESVTEKTGFVVEQGNIEGMTKIINDIIGNNSYFCRLNRREYALANFDKDRCFRDYIDLYESLAAR